MSKYLTVTFEVTDETTVDEFHEALCEAVHEGLTGDIAGRTIDIQQPVGPAPTLSDIQDPGIDAMPADKIKEYLVEALHGSFDGWDVNNERATINQLLKDLKAYVDNA